MIICKQRKKGRKKNMRKKVLKKNVERFLVIVFFICMINVGIATLGKIINMINNDLIMTISIVIMALDTYLLVTYGRK